MKICLAQQEYPEQAGCDGIAMYGRTLARALAKLGHSVYVISSTSEGEENVGEQDGIYVRRLPLAAPTEITRRKPVDLISYSKKVAAAVRVLHDEVGLDVVEFPDLAAEGHALVRNARPPVATVTRIHTPMYLLFEHDRRRWDALTRSLSDLENEVISNSTFLSAPSTFVAERVAADLGLGPERIRVQPNPVDCEYFSPGSVGNDLTVLCVGRLQHLKGTHVLVRAVPQILERFPKARFVFAGNDTLTGPGGKSYKDWMLGALSKKHWRGLDFVGRVSSNEIVSLYRRSTVVVSPSLYDNFPYVCLEAMACGKALVASAVGGIPEMVQHGHTGLLVAPDEPVAIAGAVCDLLASDNERGEMGRRARQHVLDRFEASIIAREMTLVYEAAKEAHQREFSTI